MLVNGNSFLAVLLFEYLRYLLSYLSVALFRGTIVVLSHQVVSGNLFPASSTSPMNWLGPMCLLIFSCS